jgi:choice-of-anchor A domain-containing protein/RHS repeat-associated protein
MLQLMTALRAACSSSSAFDRRNSSSGGTSNVAISGQSVTPLPRRLLLPLLALAALGASSAHATDSSCNALGTAAPYNALVFGNFSAQSSDVEGRLAAGGNVSIDNYSLADKLDASTAGVSVVIGGNFTFPTGRLYYGSAKVGGSAAGVGAAVRNGLAPGQTITDRTTLPLDFAAEKSRLEALSTSLATLAANGTYVSQWGGLTLTGKAGATLQVFDLPGQLVLDAHTFDVRSIPAGATVLINVRGTTTGLTDMSLESLAALRRRVLFNFPEATTLKLAGISVEGSVLAPRAAIDNPQGVIKGQLIAKSWNGMMQLNHEPFEGCVQAAPSNRPPVITSSPVTLALAGRPYRYDVDATDPDNDPLTYARPLGPQGASIASDTGVLQWTPGTQHIGLHPIEVSATDDEGASAKQRYELRVVQDFCPIYPIALPHTTLAGLAPGAIVNEMPRGTGPGNYSWLSWTGATDAPTLAASLAPPGDSWRYVNPDLATDFVLGIGDYAQGATGSMNASAVRDRMDALKTQDIILPVWDASRGQGSRFDYRVLRFAKVRLRDYRLTGNGWISFEYKGEATCYNAAPQAIGQQLTTDEDVALPLVLAGTDPEGDALSYAIVTPPQHGQLSGTLPNATYTPAPNYHGPDSFTFKVNDGRADSAPATVSIVVRPRNDAPQAQPQSLQTPEDTPLPITLTGSDPEGDSLTYHVVAAPARGTLSGTAPALVYTPTPNVSGTDQFTFRVNDGQLDSSLATISITIVPANDPPQADDQQLETAEDTPLPITLTGSDPDGDALSFVVLDGPDHGSLAGSAPALVYTPSAGYHGADAFTFRVSDGTLSATATVSLTVTPSNDPPLAHDQSLSTDEDEPLAITLTGTDPDGDALTYRVASPTAHGSLSGVAPNLTYTPAANFNGDDRLTFVVNDGSVDSGLATVTIVVRPRNDPPRALDQSLGTPEDTALTIVLEGEDPEGDALTFTVLQAPANGSLSGTAPNLQYTPNARYEGADSFTFKVNDGELDSAPARVTIDVAGRNEPPTIVSTPPPSVDERATYAYDVDATDPDADPLQYAIDVEPTPADIDAASGLLHWPAAHGFAGSTRAQNTMCRVPSGPGLFDPQVTWTWNGPAAGAQYSEVYGPVLVGQFTDDNGDGNVDADDRADIVAMSGPTQRYLNLIDAHSGTTHWSVRIDTIAQFGTPAIGDIDGDGGMEIVVELGSNANELRAYDANGQELWRATVPGRSVLSGGSRDAIALADLEGDGDVEIVRGATIVEHTGQVRCTGAFDGGGTRDYAWVSAVADVDLDGVQEIVAGRSIYRPDCSRVTQLPAADDGYVAIGNFDADDQAEIVLVSNGTFNATGRLYLFDHSGALKFGPITFPGGGALGPPTLANVDADPYPEIGIAGRTNYAMFDHTGTRLWNQTVQDTSSNQTGSTSFDFEADGRAEIIYSDELNLRVFDGASGTVRMILPNVSGTTLEYPVVVDADADGSADILIGANGSGRGIRKISSATRSWAPTRALWNQHTYHVDNIADDGSIPAQPARSWLGHNTYRLNSFPDRHALGLADLALFELRLDESSGTAVKVLVVNRGLAPTSAPTTLRVFNGDPDAGGAPLGTLAVPVLGAGESLTLTLSGLAPAAVDTDLYARVDEADAIVECAEDNNATNAAYFEVRATDPAGLFDTQRFTVVVENVNEAPSVLAATLPRAPINEPFRFTVLATDPDAGDGLRYELTAAPAGMAIDPVSGELRWTPSAAQGGPHSLTVRVTDLGGLSAERTFPIEVSNNRPPQIVTTPDTTADPGVAYSYDVDATDPDNDTLTYALINAPAGMSIDGSTGLIRWTPTPAQSGTHPVRVQVNDGRGGEDTQNYSIVVTPPPPNRAPEIVSTAPPSVEERATYRYDIDAIDPDADALHYSHERALAPTSVDPASGELLWSAGSAPLVSGIRARNLVCRESMSTQFDPVVRWHWQASSTLPAYDQVMNSPVVVPLRDTNGDGRVDGSDTPDIAFVSYGGGGADWGDGVVRVVRGNDGSERFTVTDAAMRVPSYTNLAAGDLDGDGIAEIVAPLRNGGVVVINHDGTIKWSNPAPSFNWNIGGASIADLDADGSPEIILGKTVYTSTGQIRWQGTGPYNGNSHASAIATFGVAADLRSEPGLEVVVGPSLYSSSGTLLWRYDALGDGATAIGDLDQDGDAEIVVVGAGQVVALTPQGTLQWGPVAMGDGGRGGPPTIADFDGDGRPEVGVAGRHFYFVFGHGGQLRWKQPIVDVSSNITGSTLFDFDGDGAAEVMQADERTFRVFDGASGTVRLEMDNSNGTAYEYPVVADVDRDGSADIVLASNLYYGGPGQKGLRVVSSASRSWMPTRSIWNQHAYHIDNVDDDGTIPRIPAKSWLGHNSFRLNAYPDRHPLASADLALFDLRLDESGTTAIRLTVVNRGLAATAAATTVQVFNGDPDQGGTLLGTLDVPVLAAGEEHALALTGLDADAIDADLYARVDDEQAVAECIDDNNRTAAAYFTVRAADPEGLFDRQRFTVTIENVNEAPQILSTQLPQAAVNDAYRSTVQAQDPDLGDGLRFELLAPPAGLTIEAVTGELRWNPSLAQIGTHAVRVRVTDLGGLFAERTFELEVSTNRPPQITSTPSTTADPGVAYSYDVEATDPDGDSLSYALIAAPPTMSIDGATGLIGWTPTVAHSGSHTIRLRVSDGRGGEATQTYTLVVAPPPPNRAPEIVSTAPASVDEGAAYAYDIDATDPDGDTLAYAATRMPSGTQVHATTGLLGWNAQAGYVQGNRERNLSCRVPSAATTEFDPVVTWSWTRGPVLASPAVAALHDSNGDGRVSTQDAVSILFVAWAGDCASSSIEAIEAGSGDTQWEFSGVGSGSHVAVGDLDGDGSPEVVAQLAAGGTVALNANGQEVWRSPLPELSSCYVQGAPSIADLDGDGSPEVLSRGIVLNADGSLKFRHPGNLWGPALDTAVDLDLDGRQELVVSDRAFSADGVELWRIASQGRQFAPLNVDADPNPELAFVTTAGVSLINHDGSAIWTRPYTSYNATPISVGDLDGDGDPELVALLANHIRALSATDGAELWRYPVSEASHATGAAVFDFNGDGRMEVVYADQVALRIFDGVSGAVLMTLDNSSATATEAPVVADIDGDGSAEVLVSASGANAAGNYGMIAIGDRNATWVATRALWNQYSYNIDNINDDGSIPAHPARSWLTHNTFRLNSFADRHPLGQPDLALFDLRLDEAQGTAVKVLVTNRGLAPTTAPAVLRVFNGNPDAGGDELGAVEVPALAAGEERTLTIGGLSANAVDTTLYARIDEADAIDECVEDNNATVAAYFEVRADDPEGSFDTQRFTVTVDDVNQAPVLLTAAVPPAGVGQGYRYRVFAQDPDRGDGLRYALVGAPAGLSIEPVSGELSWTPAAAQSGTHAFTLRVTDLGGLSDDASLSIVVSNNRPPEITSTPGLVATAGVEYTYDVNAQDADGDAIAYSLVEAPNGMQIDAASGMVRWTPAAALAGRFAVEVRVDDTRGGYALQRFEIEIAAPVNRAPTITSTPSTSAFTGRLYTYLVDATDPDDDLLTVELPIKPEGMSLNELTGQISWTPSVAQTGTHAVRVRVVDGRGGVATQNFDVVVSQIVGNAPPSIVSTPTFTAKVGREYRYPLIAEDPNGDVLTYSLTNAPAGMAIAADGRITWTPGAAGNASVRARVADAQSWVEQTWTINVLSADVPLNAVVNVSPNPVAPGGSITIGIVVGGAAGQPTISATLDGQPIALDPDGTTTLTAPTTPGSHVVIVTVNDGFDTDTTEATFNVVDPNDTSLPIVQIHAPREGATEQLLVLQSPRDAIVSVSDDHLRSWTLKLYERGVASEGILVASGTNQVANQTVGRVDPTLLLNGQYSLVLRAEDASGNSAQDVVAVSIEGAMKLGHFSITFEDLNLPVSGVPVTVSRTYDTRQRHRALDFGRGWSLSYQNVRIFESRRPGFAWEFKVYPSGPLGLIPNYCMESALGNVVSVTLADGRVEKFRARAFPECNQVLPLVDVELRFDPMPGTDGRLEVLDQNSGRLINGSIADPGDPGTPLDPSNYRYIDADGVEYTLDQNFGLRKIHERTGDNVITFGDDGIVHSNGTSVSFVRDASDRITKVIAPDASELGYEYDANGDLVAFVDAGGNRTTFTYQTGHYLRDIIDARGVRVSRNEYDDDGRLVAIIDADGNRIEYTRDIEGRSETVKDRNGGRTVYIYNDRGDVLAETNPLNQTTHRTYDADGNELTRTDALGRTQRWTYDGLGNVLTETNGAGEKTTSVYGSFNHLLTKTDHTGALMLRNTWNNFTLPGTGVEVYPGPLVRVDDASGTTMSFDYDDVTGELERQTDAMGNATRLVTDVRGFKVAEIDALGNRTDFVNDELGRVTEERRTRTRADGSTETLVTAYELDEEGNVVAVTHPDGGITRTEYDANGNIVAEVDALGRRTTQVYNDRGEVTETRYPDGTRELRSFDANGNLQSQTDRAGRTTRFVHDAANRVIETIHPDALADDGDEGNNPRTRSVYDAAGQLIESIDENGNVTRYGYDDAGRRTSTTLAAVAGVVATTTDEYDDAGRRVASVDAEGHRVEFRYDASGRLIETLADGASTRVEYDRAGRRVADIDAAGRITRYAHDGLGRTVAVVLPDPATGANPPLVGGVSPNPATLTTRYAYDELGNKVSQTDAEGRITRWEYDAMGRETARVLPGGERETKSYNAAGELVGHVAFDGRTTSYAHDANGQLESVDYPADADVSFDYDAVGNRVRVTDGRGVSSAEFDRHDRPTRVLDADGGLVEYDYDAAGNLTSRVSPSQSLVYVHDARNRLTQVTRTVDGETPTVTRYEYDDDGHRAAMLGGDGLRTEYVYDARHQLRSLVKKSAAGDVLLWMDYAVDATGIRTSVTESDASGPVRTVVYGYDAARRLLSEAIDHRDAASDRESTWSYDRVGNRLTQSVDAAGQVESTSYRYDANDRLLDETRTGAGVTSYAYDDNGNLSTKTAPGDTTTYGYDDANRMVTMQNAEGSSTYRYTADGLRIRHTRADAGGTTTIVSYVQDSAYPHAQAIERYVQVGTGAKRLEATFTFADDLVSQTRYDAAGAPSTRFVHADGFGSTRWLTDAGGAITDSIDYDAFGVEIARTGSTELEHRYRGESFDGHAGFYYLRARFYDPASGRFTRMDDYAGNDADPPSLHKYAYANANPVLYSDPTGYFSLSEMNATINTMSRMALSGVRTFGRSFIKRAASVAARTAQGLRNLVQRCRAKPERCDLDTSTYVEAGHLPETSRHVRDAQLGAGSNLIFAGFEFHYIRPGHSRRWLRRTVECNPLARDVYAAKSGKRGTCDEFPYASTREGGERHHPARVSLRMLSSAEQSVQGSQLWSFYSLCGVVPNHPKKSRFYVLGAPELPFAPPICADDK